ncbi:MAG: ABC transporter ATP-binding protein [Candidatus Tectomicrobia bacterium]|nr:ABC transporter ATP-binding protein [Candidatus Tectomicrobia bacterium]
MLELVEVTTHYGPLRILHRVSLEVRAGEMVVLLGGNAAGKSTTILTILGAVKPTSGSVSFNGEAITGLPTEQIIRRGIALVPEARRIFRRLSVRENLALGAYRRRDGKDAIGADLELVYSLFPRLKERERQLGGTLSGGEQQMLALGRALMARPQLILMDEPSMGLAPALVEQLFELIATLHRRGLSIFLVEQNANLSLSIADRAYVLQQGSIVLSGTAAEVLANDQIQRAYLGA